MAKSYKKGLQYKLLYMSAGSWGTPTWTEIKAVGDISINPNFADIEVPERGTDTGHLQGAGDPVFSFSLLEDGGDSSVTALIAAIYSGAMTTLAIADGPAATNGTVYYKMECLVTGSQSANRGDVSTWDVEAKRHGNSDNTLTKVTVSA